MTRHCLQPDLWRVRIERHTVARWIVPSSSTTIPGPDAEFACLTAVRAAHVRQGLPAWRPLLRASLVYATATPTAAVPRVSVPAPHEQLRLAA